MEYTEVAPEGPPHRKWDSWSRWVLFLLIGYSLIARSFSYLGIPPAKLFVGDLTLAAFIFLRPRQILDPWIKALTKGGPLGPLCWVLLLSVCYGIFQVIRGVLLGFPPLTAIENLVFNVYPLFLFLGMWLGKRRPELLLRFVQAFAVLFCIYAPAYLLVLDRVGWVMPGSGGVPVFGQANGGGFIILSLLCLTPKPGRWWPALTIAAAAMLAAQVRGEWLGTVVAILIWGVLSKKMTRVGMIGAGIVAILAVGALLDVDLPAPGERGGAISTTEIVARGLAAVSPELARDLTGSSNVSYYAGTITWRKRWWHAIWSHSQQNSTNLLIGPGYGYPLKSLVNYLGAATDLRTPHNIFYYALGYSGWIGVLMFLLLQAGCCTLLWRVYTVTGQAWGLAVWAAGLTAACFGNVMETPAGAIPFYLTMGLFVGPVLSALGSPQRRAAFTPAGYPHQDGNAPEGVYPPGGVQIVAKPWGQAGWHGGSSSNPMDPFRPARTRWPEAEVAVNYAALFRRHRKAVAMIGGGTLLLSVLYTLLAHKVYKAEAILEVAGINQDFMGRKTTEPTFATATGNEYIETQTRLLKSPPVLQRSAELLSPKVPAAIAARDGVLGTIKGWFGGWFGESLMANPAANESLVRGMLDNARVKVDGNSDLISVTVTGPDPQLAADTANTLTDQFLEQSQDSHGNDAEKTNRFLAAQLADARKKLQDAENDLQNYLRQAGMVTPSGGRESVAADKLRQIQHDLTQAETDEADAKAQVETAHRAPAEALPQVLDDPALRDDRARLADLRRQLADVSSTLTPANYKIQRLSAQVAALEQQSAQRRANIVKGLSVKNSESARRKRLLGAAYRQQLGVVSDEGAKEVRYNIVREEVEGRRDIYQSMLRRVKDANMVAALKSSAVRVVSRATPPNSAYLPSLPLNLGLGLLLGFVFATFYILIRERNDASLRTPGESVTHLNVPELAVIPAARVGNGGRIPLTLRNLHGITVRKASDILHVSDSAAVDQHMVHWCQDETMMADAYRSAITSILLSRVNGVVPRVILVTSPRPNAGKTTTVANLGISLAEIGRRVLLIDGDLRRPRLGKLFGLQFATGLSDALLDGAGTILNLESVVRPSTMEGLYILPGGSEPTNISKLLHSSQLDILVEMARSEYDFVLIDSPPLLGLADARLLSRNADGVILISRAGETSPEQLGEAMERLADDGTPVIGTILNGCDLRVEDPSYFDGYQTYAGAARG